MSLFESLAGVATRRPVAVCVTAVAVALVGALAFNELPIDLLPDIKSPSVVVAVNSGNRPPVEMQRLYGETLERSVFSVEGIQEIEQVARTGRLVATIHLDWDTDIDTALIDIQRALSSLAASQEVDEVIVRRFDPSQDPILILGLYSPSGQPDLVEMRQLARRQLATAVERLTGVAEVYVTGGRKREISVYFDENRGAEYGITLGQISSRISAENVDVTAGAIEDSSTVYTVRGRTKLENISDIENVVVRFLEDQSGGRLAIRVKDVATVTATEQEVDHVVLVNGQEGVGLSIYKEAGANTVTVANTIREALDGAAEDLPGIEVHEITNNATLVVDALDDLRLAAILGVTLAILVLALFLRSFGATFIVSVAVPVSIMAAIFFMHFGGYSLNIITLGGLALGAGMLVDNAIVVVESMYRRIRLGESPMVAARKGTGLVAGAIVASTLTTCVVFIPVFFVQGLAARLIDGIAFTVVVSLIASLLVAVFLIPALGRWFMGPPKLDASGVVVQEKVPLIRRKLEGLVRIFLRLPIVVVFFASAIAGVAIWFLLHLGTELLPPSDPKQFSIRYVGPSGQRVESTTNLIRGIESTIRDGNPEFVEATMAEVGRLPENSRMIRRESSEENSGRLIVRITEESPPGRFFADGLADDLENYENAEFTWELNRSALSEAVGTDSEPVVVEVDGSSIFDIRRAAESISAQLEELPELWNVKSSFEDGPPEIKINLDRTLADALGVNSTTVTQVVESSLEGQRITMMAIGDEEYPIVLQTDTPLKDQLADLEFTTAAGQRITVGEVATFEELQGPREIFRRDQRLTARITALLRDGYTQPQAIEAVSRVLEQEALPSGVSAELRGAEKERARTFGELQLAGILALILVMMVLAGTFESVLQPITILYAIPLALIGVAVALVPFGNPLGVMAMLGLIVLSGVAVNDAVLLISTAKQLMRDGKDRIDALVEAAGIRLRPITMTTLTTALALVPLLFGGGEGAVLRQPMALTIIGGLVASTVGSLLVLPCLYVILDNISRLFSRQSKTVQVTQ